MTDEPEITICPDFGGDTVGDYAYIALPKTQSAISIFLGDGSAPFTVSDSMEDVDIADLEISELQRAVLVARLRSIADQLERFGPNA